MTIHDSDALLVARHVAGDPAALAGIYDRYADVLHDTAAAMLHARQDAADVTHDVFVVAAQKLAQLRDPDRLKPWLFAILRNEVYRRTKRRTRTVATDFSDELSTGTGLDMTDDRATGADAEAVEGTELATLVRGAARGLDERDQLVLELSVRQGLDGQDLADALGVTAQQSYSLVHRMRDRVERSLGAFCVATSARRDCDDLDSMLASWDGEFTVLIRKRVARHIERCATCTDSRRRVAPLALFAAAPLLAAPGALRDRVLAAVQTAGTASLTANEPSYGFASEGGFPRMVGAGRRIAGWVGPTAAASLLMVAAGVGFWWLEANGAEDSLRSEAAAEVVTLPTTAPPTTTPPTTAPPTTTPLTTPLTTAPGTTAPRTSGAPTDASSIVPTTSVDPDTTGAPTSGATTAPRATAPPTTQRPAAPAVTTTATAPTGWSTSATTSTTTTSTTSTSTTSTSTTTSTTTSTNTTTTTTTTVPPAPGGLFGSTSNIDLGAGSSGVLTLYNAGGLPMTWTLVTDPTPFAITPTSGVLAPLGGSVDLTITLDRSPVAEGDVPFGSLNFTGGDDQFLKVNMQADPVERPPVISNVMGPFTVCGATDVSFNVGAEIVDEQPLQNAWFSMNGPNGQFNAFELMRDPASGTFEYSSTLVFPFDPVANDVDGTWTWSIEATDRRGNASTTGGSLVVAC